MAYFRSNAGTSLLIKIALLLTSIISLGVHAAYAGDADYSVLPSQYWDVLRLNGAPVLQGIRLLVAPDSRYFKWIEPGVTSSNGLNFWIEGAPLKDIADCADSGGHLDHFSGIVSPRLYENKDLTAPARFAYAMSHGSMAFHSDEKLVAKFISAGSDYSESLQSKGRIESFVVGKEESAAIKFYRSPSSATLIGVCIRDEDERQGIRCYAIANTGVAGYEVDVDPIIWSRPNRVECVLKVLSWLEKTNGMREKK